MASSRHRAGWVSEPITRAQGVHGSGARAYTRAQTKAAIELLKASAIALTVETIADQIDMAGKGRAVREICADFDGVDYLDGGLNNGVKACIYADEGDAKTRRLRNQARKMLDRADRREQYAAATLPRRQRQLFEVAQEDETEPDEDELDD